ncbi:MAG: hypothetical protein JWN38_1167 [Candidatus Saccharibacteria bacterium]|nr:hypothetical protein [Candidatus Saccharibacteria bacterium]
MKIPSPETIEQLQSYSQTLPQASYELGGLTVQYATVEIPEDQRPFPMAVAAAFPAKRVIPPRQQAGAILVSNEVPEDLRGLWAMHEYIDFAVIGHGAVLRCQNSESLIHQRLNQSAQYELSYEYAAARLGFFTNLKQYMQADLDKNGLESPYDDEDVTGCDFALELHRYALSA